MRAVIIAVHGIRKRARARSRANWQFTSKRAARLPLTAIL